jgi:glycosyltransferase involved in cell wall biosynthesis
VHFLIITRHYTPEPSGGARRPSLLVKALRKLGHKVTIITPFKQTDDPDHVFVPHPVTAVSELTHPTYITEGATSDISASPLRDWLRTWLLWPDAEIRWCRRVERYLKIHKFAPDWLITTNPPESLHTIGARVANRLGCRWLAEFRDNWTIDPHREVLETSKIRVTIERRIAKRSLKPVDAVMAVSEAILSEALSLAPTNTPSLIIGHFSEALQDAQPLPEDDINIVHTGGFTLSHRQREIQPLLKILQSAAQSRPNLHLHLAGGLTPEEIQAAKAIKDFKVTLYGAQPLPVCRALQAGSDALLLYASATSESLPGKYAEYRFANKPILVLGYGPWTGLLDDPSAITPLEEGLASLQKGDASQAPPPEGLDGLSAARKLVQFMEVLD